MTSTRGSSGKGVSVIGSVIAERAVSARTGARRALATQRSTV
jgi:hypothetical protein